MYYLGFDIGGSSLKAVLVKNKKIIKSKIQDTPKNLEGLLNLVGEIKEELAGKVESSKIGGVGIALPGAMDKEREIMFNSPNITFLNGQPIKKLLEEKLKPYSVKIEHDVHCFLLAEKEIGLAKKLKHVFFLTLGTGIGGAWMTDRKIFFGAHGAAGEAGHMIINLKTQNSNVKIVEGEDLEELAANKFIKKHLGIGSIKAEHRARAGDKKAQEVFHQIGKNLGIGIANIINIFDPEAVILSGGIADSKEFILPNIKEGIKEFVISPEAKKTKILFSELGRFGGALGASLLFDKV